MATRLFFGDDRRPGSGSGRWSKAPLPAYRALSGAKAGPVEFQLAVDEHPDVGQPVVEPGKLAWASATPAVAQKRAGRPFMHLSHRGQIERQPRVGNKAQQSAAFRHELCARPDRVDVVGRIRVRWYAGTFAAGPNRAANAARRVRKAVKGVSRRIEHHPPPAAIGNEYTVNELLPRDRPVSAIANTILGMNHVSCMPVLGSMPHSR